VHRAAQLRQATGRYTDEEYALWERVSREQADAAAWPLDIDFLNEIQPPLGWGGPPLPSTTPPELD